MAKITLVLGGARSGKSSYAESLAVQNGKPKLYIATAEAFDNEMRERISHHKQRRGSDWNTVEVPLALPDTLLAEHYQNSVILVDCLTLWLSNLLCLEHDMEANFTLLLESLKKSNADIILVSNEVGQGIVPDNALARAFRDHAGILHQRVATIADCVIWMVAGIPTYIKGSHD